MKAKDCHKVYLIGMPGVGKTTLGKKLAKHLGWDFIDLDVLIENRTKKSIQNIFEQDGEDAFRLHERDALWSTKDSTKVIIACGGGTPAFFNNIIWMKNHGQVCYLKANERFILSRLNDKNHQRPMFNKLNEREKSEKIIELLNLRTPYYEQADFSISLPLKSLEPLINMILA